MKKVILADGETYSKELNENKDEAVVKLEPTKVTATFNSFITALLEMFCLLLIVYLI